MTTTFTAATSIVPRGHDASGRGQYDVELVSEYAIMGTKPNGGYMLACLGRAALDAAREVGSTHQHVIAASAQFLSSPDIGPAQIVTEIDRVGKTASQVSATIGVDGIKGRARPVHTRSVARGHRTVLGRNRAVPVSRARRPGAVADGR